MDTDAEFVNDRWHDFGKRVRDSQVITNKMKQQIIEEGAELTALKIEYKLLDIKEIEISSYLFIELNKLVDTDLKSPEFSRRYIQMKLPPKFKQPKELYEVVSHVTDDWQTIDTLDSTIIFERDDSANLFRINGKEFVPKPNIRNHENSQDIVKIPEKDTEYNNWLKLVSNLGNKIHLTADKLRELYNKSDESQKQIESQLPDIKDKLSRDVQSWAKIDTAKSIIDERRDFGEWEKVMGAFAIETGETIARISQLMGYSEKYGSIGLLREPKIIEFFEKESTYPLYLRSCPYCLKDIAHLMNECISLYRKGLSLGIETPNIKYNSK